MKGLQEFAVEVLSKSKPNLQQSGFRKRVRSLLYGTGECEDKDGSCEPNTSKEECLKCQKGLYSLILIIFLD